MIVSDLEFFLVELGGPGASGPVRSVLVRLGTDAGVEGWGEARLAWRASELLPRREALLPSLAGRSVFDVEDLLTLEVLRHPPLRAAVETACWDIIGRAARQPLCHLWGGGYRRRIPLAVRLGGAPPQIVERSRELADQGFPTQVIPLAGRLAADVPLVKAVREAAGKGAELRLDAAGLYDLDSARQLCARLEEARLQFLLDPLPGPNLDGLARLRRQVGTPVAVCRSITGPADMLAVVRSGAAALAVVDLQLVGGIVPARKCAAIAQVAELGASLSGGPSLGIGLAAMLQLAAATPAFGSSNECGGHLFQEDLLRETPEVSDGMMAVPNAAGLGVEIDRGKLERYQVT